MTIFGSTRGQFRSIDLDTSGGQGIQASVGGSNPVGNSSLVTSFGVAQAENYSVSQCLNGGVFLYTFGHDPQRSQFSLGITSFLNPCNGSVGDELAQALKTYQAGRVSQNRQLSTLSVGSGVMTGYLIGQNIEVVDPKLSIISTAYTFIALSAHGGS